MQPIDKSMLEAAWNSYAPKNQQPQQAVKPVAQKKKKNFLVDQISTVGGIAGGIGGGILGLAAGGVGAIPGAAVGGAAGSGLGEALENILTGNKVTDNVLKETALGGIFGAGPLRGAQFAAGAAKGLAQGGGKAAVRAASDKAAETTIRGIVGNKLQGKAADLATKQFGLTDNFIANFSGRYKEDAGKTITRYGIQTAEDAQKAIAKQQGVFNSLVEGAGNIPKANVQRTLDKVAANLTTKGPSASKTLGERVKAETDQLLSQYGDEIPAAEVNKLRQQYDNLVTYTLKQSDPEKYGLNKEVADALRGTLQKATGSNQLKETGKELSKLRTLTDEIEARAPKVESRGSSPLGFRNLLGASVGGGVGLGAGGPLGALVGAGAVAAINSPTGRRAATNAAIKGGNALVNSGAKAATGQMSAGGTALRMGAGSIGAQQLTGGQTNLEDALLSAQSSQSGNALDTQMPNNTPNTMTMNDSMDSLYQNGEDLSSGMQEQSPYSRESLMADIQRDPENAQDYIKYYGQLQEIFAPPASSKLSQSSQNALASSANAVNTLNQLEGLFGKAGGGSGRIGGAIKGLAADAGFDEDAKVYNSLSQASVTQIAKALAGSGAGTVSDMDAKVIIAALPTLRDNPAEARAKFAALRQRLAAAKNNTMTYGGGGDESTLEDALLAAQGGN